MFLLIFESVIDVLMRSQIQVQNICSMIRRLRHEEEYKDTLHSKERTHNPKRDFPSIVLDDSSCNRGGKVNPAKHTKIENSRSETTFMNKPDISNGCRNKGFHWCHCETLDTSGGGEGAEGL